MGGEDHIEGEETWLTDQIPAPGTMRLFLEGNHFCRFSPRDASYQSPHKKCFRMPETKMKLQSYRDTSILTEAKCAISLKQWGTGGGG